MLEIIVNNYIYTMFNIHDALNNWIYSILLEK